MKASSKVERRSPLRQSTMRKVSLICFSNDLRISDNLALCTAARESESLVCVFVQPPSVLHHNYGMDESVLRRQHLYQTLDDLDLSLTSLGQRLHRVTGGTAEQLRQLVDEFKPCAVYRSEQANAFATDPWNATEAEHPNVQFITLATNTLFSREGLPFKLHELPNTFSKFRREVEDIVVPSPLAAPNKLPPTVGAGDDWRNHFTPTERDSNTTFRGGERAGYDHVNTYFDGVFAQTYKQTRNALDGWTNSTKFSLWLATGALSARQIVHQLRRHEAVYGSNESTYWIHFELLWREYFQWYAHRHKHKIGAFNGISPHSPKTSFYPQRFAKWCHGTTPYPIVNACMRQLNAEGYMSNRGRQLVASCLVHELSVDWRYGAAYMAVKLVDYDVASNWGNWQYLAGVGADPRGHRRFNLQKQTQIYDPDGRFIERWNGADCDPQLDSNDMVDWPQFS